LPFFSWIALVAHENSDILGFAYLRLTRERSGSLGTFVLDLFQGKSIGKILIRELLYQARSHGIRTVCLSVFNTNVRARRLYESFGFKYKSEPPDSTWKGGTVALQMLLKCR
jgi:phosphinothricin acetyltransferase